MISLQMKTQKFAKRQIKTVLQGGLVLALVAVFVLSNSFTPAVQADRFDDQINALRAQNSGLSANAAALAVQAASYQDMVDKLQSQVNSLQVAINENVAEQQSLERQIVEAQAQLDEQKRLLGVNIRTMYLEGDISTLQMLAASKDLSEFLNKQQYRNAVQDKIKASLDKITALKKELKDKKEKVETIIASLQSQRAEVASRQAEQARLLAMTTEQKNALDSQIRGNNSQIGELRRQQAIENARFNLGSMRGDPNNGGYPSVWANAPQDSMIDRWGMYNRECVSFTAWKVWNSGRNMPNWGGYGNANQWDDNARAMGIPVDYTPRVGDVAVSNAGTWGHVMYVEAIGDNGTIYISQYNASYTGQYSEGWRYTTGLVFIHFP